MTKLRSALVLAFFVALGAAAAVAGPALEAHAAASPYPAGVFVAEVSDMGAAFNGAWKLTFQSFPDGPNGNFSLQRIGDANDAHIYGGKMIFTDSTTMELVYGRGPLACTQNKVMGTYSFSLTGKPQTLTMRTINDVCAGNAGVILTTHTFTRPTVAPPTVRCGAFSVATHTWVATAKRVPCASAKKIVRRLAARRLSGSSHRFAGTYPYPGGVLTKCVAVKVRAHKAIQISCTGANGARIDAVQKK